MTHDEALGMVNGEVAAVNGEFENWLKSGELNGDVSHDLAAAFTAGWIGASGTLIEEFMKLEKELLESRLLNNHARIEALKNIVPKDESRARRIDGLIDDAIQDGEELYKEAIP